MNNELTDEELLYASEEDWTLYRKCIEGLPTREGFKGNFLDKDNIEIPHSSGPHIIRYFKETLELVKPSAILEIGFNIGISASLWLELSGAWVTSCDISDKWETKYAELYLRYKHECFSYIPRNGLDNNINWVGEFDLAFIDGAHDEKSIIFDIGLCKYLQIPYMLMDDWYPRYGETQQAVAKFPELELVKDMNNLRLYKWQNL